MLSAIISSPRSVYSAADSISTSRQMKQITARPLLLIAVVLSLDTAAVTAFQPASHFDWHSSCIPRSASTPGSLDHSGTQYDDSDSVENAKKAGIIFPGGGLFFYWQAGVIVSEGTVTSCSFRFVPEQCSHLLTSNPTTYHGIPETPNQIMKAYLRENSYDLSSILLSGASAGALSHPTKPPS